MDASEPDAYRETLAALAARGRFGIHLGLGRTRGLLRLLGEPQSRIRGALVAGTNGKGSVQAMVAAMLDAAGFRVGQAPKPHLVEYTERIAVGGEDIPRPEFVRLVRDVSALAERLPARLGPATEFELVTAAAFEWFARRGAELAVVEVGMGGRLDATNVWDGGVAVVTGVAMDHAEWLGSTIPAIAREKAAIVKRGDLAVTGATGDALAVVRRRARRLGAPLVEVAPLPVVRMDRDGLVVEAPGLGEARVALLGRHQARNAAVALATADVLEAAGVARIPGTARLRGLSAVRWPGRLELHRVRGADVLLDGAHNPDGMAALAAALDELCAPETARGLAGGRPTLVLAAMRDKDLGAMLAALGRAGSLRDAGIIATRVPLERALDPDDLVAAWTRLPAALRPGMRPEAVSGAEEAFERGLAAAREEDGPLVVAGSLYLVGAIRRHLLAAGDLRR